MAAPTIVAAGVGKRFLLHHQRATSLKERLLLHRRSTSEEFWALRDVSFTVEQGRSFGIVGENGSGKSTLAALLAGLYRPQHGTIRWDGWAMCVGSGLAILLLAFLLHHPDDLPDRDLPGSVQPLKRANGEVCGPARREATFKRFETCVLRAEPR